MRRVILESPYAGEVETNVAYARLCLHDCLKRGEAPFASHLLYTQPHVLDDAIPEERKLGIDAGLKWGEAADATVVYLDLGISKGMVYGINEAKRAGRPVEYRCFLTSWLKHDMIEGPCCCGATHFLSEFTKAVCPDKCFELTE